MSYEIRAMSFGEILDTGFRLVRNHFALFIGIGATLYVPLAFAGYAINQSMGLAAGSPEAAMKAGLAAMGLGLVMAALSPIATAAITHAIAESYLGRRASFGEALRVALSILLPLMGTFLLYLLAVMGGFLVLVIPGIYLMLAFMLVTQIMVIERRFGTRALGRSRALMKGHLLRGFGIFLVAFLLMSVLQTGVDLVLRPLPLVHAVGSGLIQAVGFAFYSSLGVLLYFDIRCRDEAFDLEHLSRVVSEAADATATA